MTDADFLLDVLSDGNQHSLSEILNRSFRERGCGLTVHSRAADLRKQGHVIVNTKGPGSRGKASLYQLIVQSSTPPPLEAPESAGSVVGSFERVADGNPGEQPGVEGQIAPHGRPLNAGSAFSAEGADPALTLFDERSAA
jgi:hypothetical protein